MILPFELSLVYHRDGTVWYAAILVDKVALNYYIN